MVFFYISKSFLYTSFDKKAPFFPTPHRCFQHRFPHPPQMFSAQVSLLPHPPQMLKTTGGQPSFPIPALPHPPRTNF